MQYVSMSKNSGKKATEYNKEVEKEVRIEGNCTCELCARGKSFRDGE